MRHFGCIYSENWHECDTSQLKTAHVTLITFNSADPRDPHLKDFSLLRIQKTRKAELKNTLFWKIRNNIDIVSVNKWGRWHSESDLFSQYWYCTHCLFSYLPFSIPSKWPLSQTEGFFVVKFWTVSASCYTGAMLMREIYGRLGIPCWRAVQVFKPTFWKFQTNMPKLFGMKPKIYFTLFGRRYFLLLSNLALGSIKLDFISKIGNWHYNVWQIILTNV